MYLLGIYEFEGDTFKSCFADAGSERPKEFKSEAGDERTLTVWRRVKPSESGSPKK
ncbi:MAG TPA: hypothetical protein VLT36_23805 [Candidatus Dormibacteraeota bacterium]|nr:hypothetical protein [Candidatus Dormibacteraeota bacterium]